MKIRILKPIVFIVLIAFFLQSCTLLWTRKSELPVETEKTRSISDKEAKDRLFKTLNKIDPINATARRQVSFYLHSLKRIAVGRIETDYEKDLLKKWVSLNKIEQQYILKRIAYFDAMPIYLQKKVADEYYFNAKLDFAFKQEFLETESAGVVCGGKTDKICSGKGEIGKLQMPEGSQGIALDPVRPLVGVADGFSGLLLINVSAPSNPTYFSSSPYVGVNTGFVNDLLFLKSGNITYILITSTKTASKSGAFEIVNVSNPMASSIEVAKIVGDYYKLSLSDDNRWAFSYNKEKKTIDIFDLANFSAPNVAASISIIGNISDLSFVNGMLHIIMQDGSSFFYSFNVDGTPEVPLLQWIFGPNGFHCAGDIIIDDNVELLRFGQQSMIVKDRCIDILRLPMSGVPVDTGIFVSDHVKHNSGTYLDSSNVIIDDDVVVDRSCEVPFMIFLKLPEIGPAEPTVIAGIQLQNEVKGIAVKSDTIYLADTKISNNCKSPGLKPVCFRVYDLQKQYTEYQDITPTIDTINGLRMYQSVSEMPTMMCGTQAILCASPNECGSTGICDGGVCFQPPIFDISDSSLLNLTGTNYWDINAKVLIQNSGSSSWIPFDANVMGDEYCDLADQMAVQLNSTVSVSGLKKIKIRNFNSDPKLRTCVNCANINDPNCTPDYVDSNEIIVYFRNTRDSTGMGFDLKITKITAKQGSNSAGDLGPNAWAEDEIVLNLPDPGDGSSTHLIPNDDGFMFEHNGNYVTLDNLIELRNVNQDDSPVSAMIKLWETDNSTTLGAALLGGGISCAGINWKIPVCGPYASICISGCLVIAAVGALMIILDGGDWIASETDQGLILTKQIARDVLQYGRCALPDSWEDDSPESMNSVLSVSDLIIVGGIKMRYITKEYICSDCPKSEENGREWGGKYRIEYRLSEHQ